jgi:hypothetical protein
MTTPSPLLLEIERTLGSLTTSYSSSSKIHDVFEGFVFTLAVDAAASYGAAVEYRDVYGAVTNHLVFRTSPGRIYSTSQAYSHAVLDFGDSPRLEVHIGVQVLGRSGVLHECDVLILPEDEAALCRQNEVAPKGNRCLLAIECKYYGSYLDLGLARGFVGLHADLGMQAIFVANVRATRVERYLTSHKRHWENGVTARAREVEYLKGQIRGSYKQHRALRNPVASSP